jgi:kumamolisin
LKPWIDKLNAELPKDRKYMSPDECNKAYGADPADLKKIIEWAQACGLKVVSSSQTSRRVLERTVADIDAAFGIQLNEYDHPKTGHYRGREGQIFVPSDLYGVIESVEGLDTRPVGHARCRRGHRLPVSWQSLKAKSATEGKGHAQVKLADLSNHWPGVFFPPQVANLYNYPKNLNGSGQTSPFSRSTVLPETHTAGTTWISIPPRVERSARAMTAIRIRRRIACRGIPKRQGAPAREP